MRMKSRIAVLAVTLAFLAAPALGTGAQDSCAPCCPAAQAPCESGDGPCASLGAIPCCETAPQAPASQAKRSLELPHPEASAPRARAPIPAGIPAPPIARDLALLTSPLRLSVVLRI